MPDDLTAGGYLPASFLGWDGHVAAVIFTSGCNFRCPFCHNSDLVLAKTEPSLLDAVIDDIRRRSKFLDGVVVSGGEPCLWPGLMPLLRELKSLGLPVKLDTNGSFPDALKAAIDEGLVEYIAMDIKAPLDEETYRRVTRSKVPLENITRSMKLRRESGLGYEFRTTYVPELLSEGELLKICSDIAEDGRWFVQCFKPNNCLDAAFLEYKAVEPETLEKLLPGIIVRG